MRRTRRRPLLALAVALAALLSGCGLGTAGGTVPSGTLTGPVEGVDLAGTEVAIGSKNFTENIILGKMMVILLKSAGADVTDLTNIPGSAAARQAMLEGEIDGMWEYTGTGWITYLGHDEAVQGEEQQFDAVAEQDLAENQLVWLPYSPMNDAYGFAMTREVAEKFGITKLSEITDLPVEERTFCVESEFTNRPDGLKGMLETYGMPLGDPNGVPDDNLKTYQTGAIYDATVKGACNFGEVFTTDGRIKALDLVVLEDDKKYLPAYNASFVIREDTLQANPAIRDIAEPLSAKLTNEIFLDLNAQVDVDGREPADVAWQWLADQGFVTA